MRKVLSVLIAFSMLILCSTSVLAVGENELKDFQDAGFSLEDARIFNDFGFSTEEISKLKIKNCDMTLVKHLMTSQRYSKQDVLDLFLSSISNDVISEMINKGFTKSDIDTVVNCKLSNKSISQLLRLGVWVTVVKKFLQVESLIPQIKCLLEMDLTQSEFINFIYALLSVELKDFEGISRWMSFDHMASCFLNRMEDWEINIRMSVIDLIRQNQGIILKRKFFGVQKLSWREQNVVMTEPQIRSAINELAPDSGFSDFVFGNWGERSRYDQISEDQQKQLKRILALKDKIMSDENCHCKIKCLFENNKFSEGGEACHNRLCDIIFMSSMVVDEMEGVDGTSIPVMLTKYREMMVDIMQSKPYEGYDKMYDMFVNEKFGAEYKMVYKYILEYVWGLSLDWPSEYTIEDICDICLNYDFMIFVLSEIFSLESLKNYYEENVNDRSVLISKFYEVKKIKVSFDEYAQITGRETTLKESLRCCLEGQDSCIDQEFKDWYEDRISLIISDIETKIVDSLCLLDGFDNQIVWEYFNPKCLAQKLTTPEDKELKCIAKLKGFKELKRKLACEFIDKLFDEGYIEKETSKKTSHGEDMSVDDVCRILGDICTSEIAEEILDLKFSVEEVEKLASLKVSKKLLEDFLVLVRIIPDTKFILKEDLNIAVFKKFIDAFYHQQFFEILDAFKGDIDDCIKILLTKT